MANDPADEPRASPTLDIVIPVYNEGRNILKVLAALQASVQTPCRVLAQQLRAWTGRNRRQ